MQLNLFFLKMKCISCLPEVSQLFLNISSFPHLCVHETPALLLKSQILSYLANI